MRLFALALLLCLPAALCAAADEDAIFSVSMPLFEVSNDDLELPQVTLPEAPRQEIYLTPYMLSEEEMTVPPPILVDPEPPIVVPEADPMPLPELPKIFSPPEIKFTEESSTNLRLNHNLLYQESQTGLEIVLRGGDNGMGITTIPFSTSFGGGSQSGAIWVDPQFVWTFVNGPANVDLPPQLYQFALGINAVAASWDGIQIHAHLAPTYATDTHNKSGDAFRLIVGGMVTLDVSDNMTLVAGATFLDRPDVPVIPTAGVLWRPQDAVEIDLIVPKPKVALRILGDEESEHWIYVKGDVGGSSWAYARESGLDEKVGYFDMRILFGIDTRLKDSGSQFEIGYVFGRELELDRSGIAYDQPDTVVFRFTSSY